MKKFILVITICTSFIGVSQNLENKIPGNAKAVISINGERLLELISMEEFDNYSFVQELIKEAGRSNDDSVIASIKDFGFNINSKAYYFYQANDSIYYHNLLIKLSDKNKFENLLPASSKEKIAQKGSTNIMNEGNMVTIWNDNILLLSSGEKSRNYFYDNEVYNGSKEDYAIRNSENTWTEMHAMDIFNGNRTQSIATNKNYLASKGKEAVASAWISYSELVNAAISKANLMRMMNFTLLSKSGMYGIENLSGNLYFDNEAARMTTKIEISPAWQKMFKKIYNSKIDKNFFNYFDQNDVLAYASFTVDMQSLLEEYPAMAGSIYGGMAPETKQETAVAVEFLSLLIDEQAISELITGDMLFILNDISEKEVEYTSYEYDSDYNRKDTIKTKKEVLPEFTIMIGSKKEKLLNKLARLGVKHKVFEYQNANYYKLETNYTKPFNLFTGVKDDIVFITTTEERMQSIISNTANSNLGKHRKLIANNVSTFFINGKLLMSKLPEDEMNRKEKGYLNFAKENFSDAYFKTSKLKGNKILSELTINAPEKEGNSLKFILNFMEVLAN